MTQGRCRGRQFPMHFRSVLAAALVVGLAALAGCTGGPSGAIGGPPTPGSINETVPGVTPPAAQQLGLADEADLAGIRVRIESVTAQDVDSTIPGEGSGPALVFKLRLRNETSGEYRTELLETALTDASGGSTSRITGAPAMPLPGTVAPGAEAEGVFVYLIAPDQRRPVTFSVSVGGGVQAAEFTGDA